MSFDDNRRNSQEPRGTGAIYRRAILLALETLNDFQTRSNIGAVRRLTQSILEDDEYPWNEVLFFKTFKSVVNAGDIDLCSKVTAELSPDYKLKVIDMIDFVGREQSPSQQQQQNHLIWPGHVDSHLPSQASHLPGQQQTLLLPPGLQFPHSSSTFSGSGPESIPSRISPSSPQIQLKPSPRRRSEHEKWKIVPKHIYDKT